MPVTRKEVENIASLAKLNFTDDELDNFVSELNEILTYMDKLNELDTENVEPLSYPIESDTTFREDIVIPSISREDALMNAPAHDEEYFKVPKVIENK
jgi:aspartyl-tRNA(Asn)/glutamyl-tRNA(Gln) amidotransferase subunit C